MQYEARSFAVTVRFRMMPFTMAMDAMLSIKPPEMANFAASSAISSYKVHLLFRIGYDTLA